MDKKMIWDFWAKCYERLWVQKYSLKPTRNGILQFLSNYIIKGKSYRIIDIGCGIGQTLGEIKESFKGYDIQLSGIDFSEEMIRRAKLLNSDIEFRQMDVKDIEFLNKSYDIIICTHSFPYYKDQPMVLRKFSRLLNKGGYLLLAQASQNNIYDHIAMFFVKFTTGSAVYPSIKAVEEMAVGIFSTESIIRINERFYMPSIYLFILKGIKG